MSVFLCPSAVFNSWSRQVYLFKDASGEGSTVTPTPTDISGSFFMGNYGASMAVDNDDGSAYYDIHDSVAYGGGHKSNFGGHDKRTYNELGIYARVYGPTCFRISDTSGPAHPESYFNNTCIIDPTVTGFNVYDLRIELDSKNATNNGFRASSNTIYAPGGADASTRIGTEMKVGDWLKLGLEKGTTISGQTPSNAEIEAMARTKLGL